MEAPAAPESSAGNSNVNYIDQSTGAEVERLVVKNAKLSIVVNDPSDSVDRISRMADAIGGFVVSTNLYQTELENGAKVWRATMAIRVPVETLNDAIEQVKAESQQDPITETVNSQDVTGEYTDQKSRLRNLESAEEQLTKIMESAVKTEDVLTVYSELVRNREQIEVIKGQIKYYEESAAMSSISIELIPDEAMQPLTIGGWQPVGILKDAVQGLIDTLKVLYEVIVRLVINVLPVLAILYVIFVLPFMLIIRSWRRRRALRKQTAKEATPNTGSTE